MSNNQPNVLFILFDQLRADALSAYGGKDIATPNLDRLATQGMRFTNALSTCPVCTPYRGMMMTGRYPTHTGIVVNGVEVNTRGQQFLAGVFRDAGYQTGYIGKWHLAPGVTKLLGKYRLDNAKLSEYRRLHPEESFIPEFVPPGETQPG